jgi:glucose-1-phosphate adenylyltransferase
MTPEMDRVASVILGGGRGTRLFPLTSTRSKPAIGFGGRYRLIDVPLSNSINSGIRMMFVITQFFSSSLHHYLFRTYQLDHFSQGFLEVLGAEQRPAQNVWFEGTADAVRQNKRYLIEAPADYFLILSGDQLYTLDFRQMVAMARDTNADLVVASLPVEAAEAQRMGLMKTDTSQRITEFEEKPSLDRLPKWEIGSSGRYLGSMGIYLFKREALFSLLDLDPGADFGKQLIPTQLQRGNSFAYRYDGYWEDIGTISTFHAANLALTDPEPLFRGYDQPSTTIYARPNHLPGAKIHAGQLQRSILCEGCSIDAARIERSIIGIRSIIQRNSTIEESILMGNDSYGPAIGPDCHIRRAIIDSNAHLGAHVQLLNKNNLTTYDSDSLYVRDGIIIVPQGATLPDNFQF